MASNANRIGNQVSGGDRLRLPLQSGPVGRPLRDDLGPETWRKRVPGVPVTVKHRTNDTKGIGSFGAVPILNRSMPSRIFLPRSPRAQYRGDERGWKGEPSRNDKSYWDTEKERCGQHWTVDRSKSRSAGSNIPAAGRCPTRPNEAIRRM